MLQIRLSVISCERALFIQAIRNAFFFMMVNMLTVWEPEVIVTMTNRIYCSLHVFAFCELVTNAKIEAFGF